jgi:phosphate transport system permease protein
MARSLGTLGGQDAVEAQVRLALEGNAVDWRSRVWEAFLVFSLIVSFFFLIWLLVSQVIASMPVWQERGVIDFLTSPTNSSPDKAGVSQGVFGSIVLMVVVSLLALPIGVAAAIYLEEYAPDNLVSRTLNTIIRNLAGVPAVVYGILGLSIFVLAAEPLTGGRTVISGGLTLAVLVLPIAIIVTAEALRAVPASIREAGFGVGATRWEVIRSHVLPYAAPGILTGVILTMARAFGETAPLLLVGAVAGSFSLPRSATIVDQLAGPYTSLPTVIYNWSVLPQQGFRALTAAAIVVLLVIILLINAVAIYLRNRYARKW